LSQPDSHASWKADPVKLFLLALASVVFYLAWTSPADAAPSDPGRHQVLTVNTVVHVWWVTEWRGNQVKCEVYVDHDGLPTRDEILEACGRETYDQWIETAPCASSESQTASTRCKGLYLHDAGKNVVQKMVSIDLPTPYVSLSLEGCNPQPPANQCDVIPRVVLKAHEPLPNEHIIRIRGSLDGVGFTCESDSCVLDVGPTRPEGASLYFWADSSFGDSSAHYEAAIRITSPQPNGSSDQTWFVDVLSSQWEGAPPPACSTIWGAFTPAGGPPAWLSTPPSADGLKSDFPYAYLTGTMIREGLIDAGNCPDAGLLPNGAANACGVSTGKEAVTAWQNRFDQLIFDEAKATGIPAQLMKRLFARESQFWPGTYDDKKEIGLGQLTESGADTTLLWNGSFFSQFCPLVLDSGACAQGYARLLPGEQALLRGALTEQVNAACKDCSSGVDLKRAKRSVEVFGATLLANCQQVGWMVSSTAEVKPGGVSSYEDLWRMSLANYNAGPGCLSQAMKQAWRREGRLDWATVSSYLDPACQGSIGYVESITGD
jgi:hypothetical protein